MPEMPRPDPVPSDHTRHDPLLVARADDADLSRAERDHVAALLATCPVCRQLAADLRAVSRAVTSERVPARPRDFRLTPEGARRARGPWWRRAIARVALPDTAILRPLAGSVLGLGLVLVVVGTVLPTGVTQPPTVEMRVQEPAPVPVTGPGFRAAPPATAEIAPLLVDEAAPSQRSGPAAPEAGVVAPDAGVADSVAPASVLQPMAAASPPPAADADSSVESMMAEPDRASEGALTQRAPVSREAHPQANDELVGRTDDTTAEGASGASGAAGADADGASKAADASPAGGARPAAGAQASGSPPASSGPRLAASPSGAANASAPATISGSASLPGGGAGGGDERALLVSLGLLLTLLGLVLAALIWLSRRARDPLLR